MYYFQCTDCDVRYLSQGFSPTCPRCGGRMLHPAPQRA
jgi:Zn finger protein HypA/HybF involved in hydrogenase expression